MPRLNIIKPRIAGNMLVNATDKMIATAVVNPRDAALWREKTPAQVEQLKAQWAGETESGLNEVEPEGGEVI